MCYRLQHVTVAGEVEHQLSHGYVCVIFKARDFSVNFRDVGLAALVQHPQGKPAFQMILKTKFKHDAVPLPS